MNKKLIKRFISVTTTIALAVPMLVGLPKAFAEKNKIPVDFTKVDADTDSPLEGATIAVKKLTGTQANTGTVIFTGKTDANGKLIKDNNNANFFDSEGRLVLDAGPQYEFVETGAPQGYILNQRGELQNTVKSDTENPMEVYVTIGNTKQSNVKNYLRVNTQNGKFSEFDVTLYKMKNAKDTDPKNGTKVFVGTTDAYDGKLSRYAKYDPDGYLLNGDLSLPDNYYILTEGKTNRSYRINFANRRDASILLLSNSRNGSNSNSSGTNSTNTGSNSSSKANKTKSNSSSSLAKTGIASFTPIYLTAGTMIAAGGTILFKKKK